MMLCHLHRGEEALSRQGTDLIDEPPVEPEASVLSFNQAVSPVSMIGQRLVER
jgi:hypothetical protein